MSGNGNFYHMIIFLEEPIEVEEGADPVENGGDKQEVKSTHEFVEELALPFQVDEIDALNEWFDKFDEKICIPHEGHIKYEITSDGMMVLLLDKELEHLVGDVKTFIEENSS